MFVHIYSHFPPTKKRSIKYITFIMSSIFSSVLLKMIYFIVFFYHTTIVLLFVLKMFVNVFSSSLWLKFAVCTFYEETGEEGEGGGAAWMLSSLGCSLFNSRGSPQHARKAFEQLHQRGVKFSGQQQRAKNKKSRS